MSNSATSQQLTAIVQILNAIHETIAEAGSEGTPSGVLYAALMGKMSLDQYNMLISILKQAGKIKETGHLLTSLVEPNKG